MSTIIAVPRYEAAEHEVLASELDQSVNFVTRGEFPGAIEARYVRRCEDEVIVYLSSQTGCRKACRFCHLTQSGQTQGIDLGLEEYFSQAEEVLAHYGQTLDAGGPRATLCNYNFMSRGEVFANRVVLERAPELIAGLAERAATHGLAARMKFSTIIPTELEGREFTELFGPYAPDIYYSLYSADERWRKRWLPKALPAREGLTKLARYAALARKLPVLHWALIAGENDTHEQIEGIIAAVAEAGLRCDFNLVLYNPFSANQGAEASEESFERCAHALTAAFPGSRVQIVGRVGHDVKASCGMFVPGRGTKKPEALLELPVLPSSESRYFGGQR